MINEQNVNNVNPRVRYWRKRYLVRGLAIAGVLVGVATGTWAVDEAAKLENVGLRGLFSNTVPNDLNADEFAKLGGNWATWSQGAATAVSDFYTKLDSADVAGQRAALGVLKSKLEVMHRALGDARYAALFEPLTLLHGRLSQRVAIAEAALDTLTMDQATLRTKRVAKAAADVNASIAAMRSSLGRISNGLAWIPYTKADAVEKALKESVEGEAALEATRTAKERIARRNDVGDESQKKFMNQTFFVNYERTLDDYATAVAWQPSAENDAQVRSQLKTLLEAVDAYTVSRSGEDAAKIRTAYQEIRKVAPDGGDRISEVMLKYALNYNVRVIASEEFLNRLMSDTRTDNGPVVDNVLGAAVTGNQTTTTNVSVDLLPAVGKARFDIVINGVIHSNTVGVTSEATVYTQGDHTFQARKEVNFDGNRFATGPATISVQPHNTTTGVGTNMGGMLFGGIAQRIASEEVEKRRGMAESIAADRVRSKVLPEFNTEVDRSFSDAGSKLEKNLFAGMRATGLYPDAFAYQTTNSSVLLNSRMLTSNEAGANLPRIVAPSQERGATLMMHESAVNNSINRMGLAGQTLTEPELRTKLEEFLSKALSRPVKLAAPNEGVVKKEPVEDEKGPNAIIFAAADPIRVGFDNGVLTLILKAGFKQEEGKEDIPTREITVPITFEVKGPKILATRGDIAVAAADGGGGGIAINGVVRKKIQAALPEREIDSKFDIKGPKKTIAAKVVAIKIADGWVAVTVN